MPPKGHARLSPSSAHRWTRCPRSIGMAEHFPRSGSVYTEEGTLAHALAEAILSAPEGERETDPAVRRAEKLADAFCRDHPEMDNNVEAMRKDLELYVEYVDETTSRALLSKGGGLRLLETDVDLSAYVPECHGTADAVVICDDFIEIVDLKYGKNTLVEAEDNEQLMIYALGALDLARTLTDYDPPVVVMTIVQPRMYNISTDSLTVKELTDWGTFSLSPCGNAALSDDRASAGEWCRWCAGDGKCKAQKEYYDELEKTHQAWLKDHTVSPEDLAEVLDRSKSLESWLKKIRADALEMVLQGGEIPGYKLVAGRSVRRYKPDSETAVVTAAEEAGYPEAMLFDRKLLSITAMEKLLGKKTFNEVLGDLVEKPEGAPTLAPLSDKRQAINTVEADFEDDLI